MSSFDQVQTTRHEYWMKAWQKLIFMILGVFFLVLGTILAPLLISSNSNRAFSIMMTMVFFVLGVFLLAQVLRSRLVVDGSRIEVRGAKLENGLLHDVQILSEKCYRRTWPMPNIWRTFR